MTPDSDILRILQSLLDKHIPPLTRRKETDDSVEYAGTKEAMQGRQKVDGFYFASLVRKPRDIRFYFFPIYTHADHFPELSPKLKKFLKGKSCFHIKNLDNDLLEEVSGLIEKGISLYQKDGLI